MKFPTPHAATTYRRKMCNDMSEKLRFLGYDCDPAKVNRNYVMFRRWWDGRLSLGYLVRRAGLKRIRR